MKIDHTSSASARPSFKREENGISCDRSVAAMLVVSVREKVWTRGTLGRELRRLEMRGTRM